MCIEVQTFVNKTFHEASAGYLRTWKDKPLSCFSFLMIMLHPIQVAVNQGQEETRSSFSEQTSLELSLPTNREISYNYGM